MTATSIVAATICFMIFLIISLIGLLKDESFLLWFALPSLFFGFLNLADFCKAKEKPFELSSTSYEITVNEKSFKTSDFKTKSDGSIEFTADDGTIIRASEYEIRKLN